MAASDPEGFVPPRVLLVMPDQWPRALLRAALREVGYDALGAPGLAGAMRYRAQAPGRGPVRLVVVDQSALEEASATLLPALLHRHEQPASVLLTRVMKPAAMPDVATPASWTRIVRRPVSIAGLVAVVRELLPLPPEAARPID